VAFQTVVEVLCLGLSGVVPLVALLAVSLGVPLWLARTPLRVTVYDPARRPAAGAVVYGHVTRRFGGYVGPNDQVVESSTEEGTVRLGRTGPDGVLATTLLVSNPWALRAVSPAGRSATKRLAHRAPGEGVVLELHLQAAPRPKRRGPTEEGRPQRDDLPPPP
jgi:hypothetical protein